MRNRARFAILMSLSINADQNSWPADTPGHRPSPRDLGTSREERIHLKRWTRTTVDRDFAKCACIELLTREGNDASEVAHVVGVSVRRRLQVVWQFSKRGVNGPREPRVPDRRWNLHLDRVMEIPTMTIEDFPNGVTLWSPYFTAHAARVLRRQVPEIWRAAGSKLHRFRTCKVSHDSRLAGKVVDIVGLYTNALSLSAPKKMKLQALDRAQPMSPLRPGAVLAGIPALRKAICAYVKAQKSTTGNHSRKVKGAGRDHRPVERACRGVFLWPRRRAALI